MNRKIRIDFKGHDNLTSSAISHYIQQTDINYVKLMIIQNICSLIESGINPDNFVVATKSSELYKTNAIEYDNTDDYIILASKQDSAKKFWNIINRHHRPVVFYKENNEYIPIFNYSDENRLLIRNIKVNSPVAISLEGAGSSMVDLYYASDREQRSKIEWENQQLGQVAQNIDDIARASSTINNPNVSDGVKVYANNILSQVMARQVKLNQDIGISDTTINVLA